MQNHVVPDGDRTEPYSGLPLTLFRDGRSVPVFANILRDKEEPWYLKRTAVKHLKSLKHLRDVYQSESYISALEAAAGDEDEGVARIAQETLKEIKAKPAY